MSAFVDFLRARYEAGGLGTEDVLAAFLPLARQALAAHEQSKVAPLEGIDRVLVDGTRLYFAEVHVSAPRLAADRVRAIERPPSRAFEVIDELSRTIDVDRGIAAEATVLLGIPGRPPDRPMWYPGYVSWEHELGHHDASADVAVLGRVLASLATGLDLSEPEAFERFVRRRRNLFALRPDLHPVIAKAIVVMTELDRARRTVDLAGLILRLERYRDVDPGFEVDLARAAGAAGASGAAPRSTRDLALERLRERLFEISRRNRLLYFKPTSRHLNLAEASVPILIDVRNLKPEHLLTWTPEIARTLAAGSALPLQRWLRFEEQPFLPGVLDKIICEARRDQAEYGFAQLRLVIAFLEWHNLKEERGERIRSPLLLLPVKLTRKKGLRDQYAIEPTTGEAEVNPVLRHHLRTLYGIRLPETVELGEGMAGGFHALLESQVKASEPGITLRLVEKPEVRLVHERARRRVDLWRRRERLSGRGVRVFGDLEYSYDRENFHPLGLTLFQTRVRPSRSKLGQTLGDAPVRAPQFAQSASEPDPASPGAVEEKARSVLELGAARSGNPYEWDFDLANPTVGNFKYRKMSLVRDYDALIEQGIPGPAFDAVFSSAPRAAPTPAPELAWEQRYPVVACDPTQASSLAAARAGRSYVIQGPPGTGKSQTITNLIADFVAQGKRVLFVCEKRAALDVVFHRLRASGLHELCCLIHDTQADKKDFILDLKQTYESFLQPAAAEPDPEKVRRAHQTALRREVEALERFDSAMREPLPNAGVSGRKLLQRAVELADRRPAEAQTKRVPAYEVWARHEAGIGRFARALAEAQADGVFRRHPLSGLDARVAQVSRPLDAVQGRLAAALGRLETLDRALRESGAPERSWDALERARGMLDFAVQAMFLVRKGLLDLLDAQGEKAKAFARTCAEQRRRLEALQQAQAANGGWREKLPPGETKNALAQARTVAGAFLSFVRPAWWTLRSVLNRCYDFSKHKMPPTWVQVLEALDREHEAAEVAAAGERHGRDEWGLDEGLGEFTRRGLALRDAVTKAPSAAELLRRLRGAPSAAAAVERLAGAQGELTALERELDGFLAPVPERTLTGLRGELERLRAAGDRLAEFLPCLGELAGLPPEFVEAVRRLPWDAPALESAMAERTLAEAFAKDRELERFSASARARHVEKAAEAHAEWQENNARVVRERVRRNLAERVRISSLTADQLTPEQKPFKKRYAAGRKELEHEFGKTMRYRSVRDLMGGESGEVLQDLKPVWLMSPLSVSDALPLEVGRFDVVIFDEASQIPLEDAVPSLFRAPQAIVVGDRMQMPPTRFFAARREVEEGDGEGEEEGGLLDFDAEGSSFLTHAANVLPATLLGWHYRSRFETLIGFSNAAFYRGRLLTVPDVARMREGAPEIVVASPEDGDRNVAELLGRSMSFHRLTAGLYRNRRNEAEAAYVARLVRGILKGGSKKTIGIVAFSEAQQGEIESALDALARQDAEFADLVEEEYEREEEGQFLGLLVKNLENIQGDERDVVILSVCYGPGPDGKMLMNFGPINQEGGEKRLNVAFSRAKQHMAVVSSIRYERITNVYNDGANCLRNYLRYAAAVSAGDGGTAKRVLEELHGREEEGAAATAVEEDAVIGQLAGELEKRGWAVDRGVGLSHFRCDLAVRRPEERAYRLAVLVDTAAHYEQRDVLAREVQKPALLRAFGWQVAHVLTKDWHADRAGVVKAVEKALGV